MKGIRRAEPLPLTETLGSVKVTRPTGDSHFKIAEPDVYFPLWTGGDNDNDPQAK